MRDIKGFEGKYAITEDGKVWSYIRRKYLKTSIAKNGYANICLYDANKKASWHLVHRLVALTYLDNLDNLPCVNHKDENKLNNAVSNLEWCTYQYNHTYGSCVQRAAEGMKKKWSNADYRNHISSKIKENWSLRASDLKR